jgi:hypothetical protein
MNQLAPTSFTDIVQLILYLEAIERRAQTPRKPRHRRAAVRQQRRRSGGIRPKPHRVARLDSAIRDEVAGQGAASM